MPLTVRPRIENEIALLELEGSLTLGPDLQGVREAAKRLLAESKPRGLILDVKKVTGADSAGLGELTVVYSLASRQSCAVALACVPQNLATMLQVTHLDGLLPAGATVPEAKTILGLH